jgi:hypothetical protein
MRRLTSILLTATLMAGALTTIAAAPASACRRAVGKTDVFSAMKSGQSMDAGVVRASKSGGMEQVSLLTLNLEVAEPKATYKIGETAEIEVTVTRPAKEDPLGNGIPMDRPYVEPAEGVIVGVGLHIGRVFLPGAAITDAQGVAKIKIKIESYAPVGQWADMSVYAWKVAYETTCATLQEYGYQSLPRQFKTTKSAAR